MCQIDDAEPCEFLNVTYHTACKQHKCDECRRVIRVKEIYEKAVGKADGTIFVSKTCEYCQEAREWLVKECGGYVYGGVLQDLQDHMDEGYRHGSLTRLVVGMSRKWKKFTSDSLMSVPQISFERRETNA